MTGYDYVGNAVRQFWKEDYLCDVVCLLLCDGAEYEVIAYCESDRNYEDVTFNYDWWEGEENIVVQHIEPLSNVLQAYRYKYEEEKGDTT